MTTITSAGMCRAAGRAFGRCTRGLRLNAWLAVAALVFTLAWPVYLYYTHRARAGLARETPAGLRAAWEANALSRRQLRAEAYGLRCCPRCAHPLTRPGPCGWCGLPESALPEGR